MSEHKILFTGTVGAGKTTAIAAVSDAPPVSTDVFNSDRNVLKATTTVGLDFGEMALPNGEKLRLYGTPGQERFNFMWPILAEGALGLVILIDNSRPAPLEDFRLYLRSFTKLIRTAGCVVAIGRTEQHPNPSLDDFSDIMFESQLICPVIAVDVRQREQVRDLIDLLLLQIEAKTQD